MSLADCPICAGLSMYSYDNLMEAGPRPAIVALLGHPPYAGGSGTVRCPHCRTCYQYVYDCGFMEHDIELKRISPAAAGDETDVAAFTRQLSHPDADTREYAVLALVEHHLAHGATNAVIALLTHRDLTVKIRAIVTVLYSNAISGRFCRRFSICCSTTTARCAAMPGASKTISPMCCARIAR